MSLVVAVVAAAAVAWRESTVAAADSTCTFEIAAVAAAASSFRIVASVGDVQSLLQSRQRPRRRLFHRRAAAD